MVQFSRSRRACSFFLLLLLISYLCSVFAQQALIDCVEGAVNEYASLAETILSNADVANFNIMSWCPVWAALCSYFYRTCPSLITCRFTNLDHSISTRYDPSSATNYLNFQNCNDCSVQGKHILLGLVFKL